jgi:hypothetical protein
MLRTTTIALIGLGLFACGAPEDPLESAGAALTAKPTITIVNNDSSPVLVGIDACAPPPANCVGYCILGWAASCAEHSDHPFEGVIPPKESVQQAASVDTSYLDWTFHASVGPLGPFYHQCYADAQGPARKTYSSLPQSVLMTISEGVSGCTIAVR